MRDQPPGLLRSSSTGFAATLPALLEAILGGFSATTIRMVD
ncbi:hypothetical protein V5P93_005795 [Actinokineospora auranticolor]|nr:hypothetical protein [Actinokineospora auranticolor]